MQMPKPSETLSATFDGIVTQFETIEQKKVFGCPSAFVNGNMFASVFGDGSRSNSARPTRRRLWAREASRTCRWAVG